MLQLTGTVGAQSAARLRTAARGLTAVSIALLLAGVICAYIARGETGALAHTGQGLAAFGTLVTVLALLLVGIAESSPAELTVPDEYRLQVVAAGGLPAPSWWGPLGAAALVLTITGLLVDRYTAGLGAGLLLVSAVAAAASVYRVLRARGVRAEHDGVAPLDRQTVRTARRLADFAAEHGGAQAVVENIGRYGARIALVGGDGRLGDQVVADMARGELACRVAGVELHVGEWPRELSSAVVTTRDEWWKMGKQPA
ncbi:MAG: hypothetical protein JWM67_2654 [Mycobacterium sp.]|nr:hypothetical protein [Mycobacterium sp.]